MTKTEHFELNQWDGDDPVIRTDFNADNAKLDAALEQLATGIVVGSYTGELVAGSSSTAVTRIIPLPFTPRFLIVSGRYKPYESSNITVFTVVIGARSHTFEGSSNSQNGNVKIVENGFQTKGFYHNSQGSEEYYFAIR